jgi:N-acetylglutamate synthase-like GNAT family acetyltransferase
MFSDDYHKPAFLVCEEEGAIIGAAAISEELFTVNTWGISWLAVHPDHQKQGLGSQMIEGCVEEIARRIKVPSTVILAVYDAIAPFYYKAGFSGTTRVHDEGGGLYLTRAVLPKLASSTIARPAL